MRRRCAPQHTPAASRSRWAPLPSADGLLDSRVMPEVAVLVFARPDDPGLVALERAPAGTRITVAHDVEEAVRRAPEADALLITKANAAAVERIWRAARRLRWIHTRPAGVDHLLFADLAASAIPMTNSRGVFSASLAEFAVLGLLFFLKDTRRMLRSQDAAQWD